MSDDRNGATAARQLKLRRSNERVKLLATLLNGIAIAIVVVSLLSPTVQGQGLSYLRMPAGGGGRLSPMFWRNWFWGC